MLCGLLSTLLSLISLFSYNPQMNFLPEYQMPRLQVNSTGDIQSYDPYENQVITILVVAKKRRLRTAEINRQIALVFRNFEEKIDKQLTPEAVEAPISQLFFTLTSTMKKCNINLEDVD